VARFFSGPAACNTEIITVLTVCAFFAAFSTFFVQFFPYFLFIFYGKADFLV